MFAIVMSYDLLTFLVACYHLTFKKRYISTFTTPIVTKLDRMIPKIYMFLIVISYDPLTFWLRAFT